MEDPAEDLVRATDITQRLGVSRAVVSNWRRRHPDYPEPAQVIATVERWRWEDITAFLNRNGLPRPPGKRKPAPRTYELLRNGNPIAEYRSRGRARIALIMILASMGEPGLDMAEAVLSNGATDEVEIGRTVFHLRTVNRRRRRATTKATKAAPAESGTASNSPR
ncbi:helix-turn-helix transcriptional regulator [Actinomadura violacea]|uniref:Uncharacterized protein n=1 Tax=Actinomadura violacea TaxID=2819934 RepID=A0ABS3RTP2_9ACTN|nr:hypothetical protein [Actinomadura violacea]MBO2459858.1 hypothetical protein [Actinomadura violacea]